ncbi:UbiX family flavin prenyltransferase [Agarilytica rhodophyticola]|uniref:UbiX family flavin prenyltransferase n=1 Tax=Agarilytica rhodophyticola TaxID=1737490 RepID=UPI000B3489F0|nr:flavin prenyltransferase UbiX [Agarilytica rhodophyticola]
MSWHKTITLAITGASGAQYGLRLLRCLIAANCRVYLLLSGAGRIVINTETDLSLTDDFEKLWDAFCRYANTDREQLVMFDKSDWFAPVASGSSSPVSMVICPASGGTLSSIAHGASNNLIERAADVALKERRQLIMVPRETPYSEVHLENMLKLTRMGCVILPASPGFYQSPKTVDDLVDFVVARIMDQLGMKQDLLARWGE